MNCTQARAHVPIGYADSRPPVPALGKTVDTAFGYGDMPRIALTDRFCAAAKARGGRTDYFDEQVPGLALRVADTGRKVWTFHYTSPRDGKRARHSLGTYPAASLAMARGLAIEARQLVEDGTDPRKRDAETGAAERP